LGLVLKVSPVFVVVRTSRGSLYISAYMVKQSVKLSSQVQQDLYQVQ